mmetsp:Transcript_53433/g.97727  ORF Transcript_53433/g.97727 Transcript_53433/m.97727 type:complete len:918 (-) Transcript_53433:38-2791(-)
MAELSYSLPPKDRSFAAAVHGLKKFSVDLASGGTDSGGHGFEWKAGPPPAPAPPQAPPPPRRRPSRPICASVPGGERPSSRPRSSGSRASLSPSRVYGANSTSSKSRGLPCIEIASAAGSAKLSSDLRGLTIAIPRAFQQSIDFTAFTPPAKRCFSYNCPAPKLPVSSGQGHVVTLPHLAGPPAMSTGDEPLSARAPIRPPPLPKHRSLEEYVCKASRELLSEAGTAHLVWCTNDGEADYRRLRPGEYFNHFQHNDALTTKVGLAQSLLQHAVSSGMNADRFFPRCYDVAQRGEREEFILDFRRSAALKVALQHVNLDAQRSADPRGSSYRCNLDMLKAARHTLQRWCYDLDPEHLDEENDACLMRINDETWDALVLYSELSESQLRAGSEEEGIKHPRRRYHRIGGGDILDERPWEQVSGEAPVPRSAAVQDWAEFRGHSWGAAPAEWRRLLEELLERLQHFLPQWSLQGGWMGRNVWVVKPGSNSKGSGVECMNTLPELLHHCDTMPNRVIQKYIERPLLLFSGRKFDIRQWVLVRSTSPLRVFLFSECYLRLCNEMYDLGDLKTRERHISNWQVNKHGKNVIEGACVSLPDFKSELLEITGSETFWEDRLLPQLQEVVIETLRAAEPKLTPRQESFELYGFDLMVDEAMQLWLLEVNLSPGCEGRTPFLDRMLTRMAKRLVEVAVLGKEEPDGEHPDWLKIADDAATDRMHQSAGAAGRPGNRDLPCTLDLTLHGQSLRLPRRRRPASGRPLHCKPAARSEARREKSEHGHSNQAAARHAPSRKSAPAGTSVDGGVASVAAAETENDMASAGMGAVDLVEDDPAFAGTGSADEVEGLTCVQSSSRATTQSPDSDGECQSWEPVESASLLERPDTCYSIAQSENLNESDTDFEDDDGDGWKSDAGYSEFEGEPSD